MQPRHVHIVVAQLSADVRALAMIQAIASGPAFRLSLLLAWIAYASQDSFAACAILCCAGIIS